MDMKEAEERVVIAKPVATKPTCTNFNSVSELLAGAIRPKTARFKPIVNHPPASLPSTQVESCGIAASSDKIRRSEIKSTVLYKPQAKFVSKTTISILSNMPNVCAYQGTVPSSKARAEHPKVDKLNNQSNVASDRYCEVERTSESLRLTSQNCQEEEDPKALAPVTNGDRPSYDGYNWRKYGQKQVKGSEYPRSYYKCTHPNCPVKKKVERSFDGGIAEIVYRGEHNHPKPQPPKRNESGMQALGLGTEVTTGPDKSAPLENNCVNQRNETSDSKAENQNDIGSPAAAAYSTCQQDKSLLSRNHAKIGSSNAGEVTPDLDHSCGLSKECDDECRGDDEPRSKRWKSENQSTDQAGTIGVDPQEPHAVIRSSAEPEMLSDGFRWRKYGQKVVKGNPYPRSYYRCTGLKCNVRKHVERALDDPSAFVTTYEGKHNHEMPLRSTKPVAPESDSQSPDLQR